jgi:hypothetical protein
MKEQRKHTLTVELSQAGQVAALAAGEPAQEDQVYELDSAQATLLVLEAAAYVRPDGSVQARFRTLVDRAGGSRMYKPLDVRPTDAGAAVAVTIKAVEAARAWVAVKEQADAAAALAERAAIIEAARATPLDELATHECIYIGDGTRLRRWTDIEELADLREAALARSAELAAEKARQATLAREERERLAALARMEDLDAVMALGSASQRKRFEAGVLPASELDSLRLTHWLPVCPDLVTASGYVAPSELEGCCDGDEYDGAHQCTSLVMTHTTSIKSLTHSQWDVLSLVQAHHEGDKAVSVEAVAQRLECADCDAYIEVERVRVTRTLPSGNVVRRYYML